MIAVTITKAELDNLRRELREAQDECAAWRMSNRIAEHPPSIVALEKRFGLTRSEAALLDCLLTARVMVSRERLFNVRVGTEPLADLSVVNVFVARIRKKLAAHGISHAILTHWGRGYRLADGVAAVILAQLA